MKKIPLLLITYLTLLGACQPGSDSSRKSKSNETPLKRPLSEEPEDDVLIDLRSEKNPNYEAAAEFFSHYPTLLKDFKINDKSLVNELSSISKNLQNDAQEMAKKPSPKLKASYDQNLKALHAKNKAFIELLDKNEKEAFRKKVKAKLDEAKEAVNHSKLVDFTSADNVLTQFETLPDQESFEALASFLVRPYGSELQRLKLVPNNQLDALKKALLELNEKNANNQDNTQETKAYVNALKQAVSDINAHLHQKITRKQKTDFLKGAAKTAFDQIKHRVDQALNLEKQANALDPKDLAAVESGAKIVGESMGSLITIKSTSLGQRIKEAATNLADRIGKKAEELIKKYVEAIENAKKTVPANQAELKKLSEEANQNYTDANAAAKALASLKDVSPALKNKAELMGKEVIKAKGNAQELENRLKAQEMVDDAKNLVDNLAAELKAYQDLTAAALGSNDKDTLETFLEKTKALKDKFQTAKDELFKKYSADPSVKVAALDKLREDIDGPAEKALQEYIAILRNEVPKIAKDNQAVLDQQLELIKNLVPDPKTKVAPLRNCGNTCYMNAVTQALFHTRELNRLWQMDLDLIPFAPSVVSDETLLKIMRDVFQNYMNDAGAIDTSPLANARTEFFPQFQPRAQEDAEEYLNALLGVLSEELNIASKLPAIESFDYGFVRSAYRAGVAGYSYSLITHWFQGFFKSTFTPKNSPDSNISYEPFSILQLSFPDDESINPISLEDMYKNYQAEETFDDGSKKKITIQKAPRNMIVQLKRFKYYLEDGQRKSSRIDTKVLYPLLWDCATETGNVKYELYAIVLQNGSLDGGHYTAKVKAGNKWYFTNDDRPPVEIPENEALNEPLASYVLFYRQAK